MIIAMTVYTTFKNNNGTTVIKLSNIRLSSQHNRPFTRDTSCKLSAISVADSRDSGIITRSLIIAALRESDNFSNVSPKLAVRATIKLSHLRRKLLLLLVLFYFSFQINPSALYIYIRLLCLLAFFVPD